MNKVILMGRLTKDPEIRYGGENNQTAIARFSLAVDRRYRKSNNEVETDFFNCTAFGKIGEFVERYLHKGIKVLLTGEVQNNNYTDRSGNKVYSVQILANEIEFAESKRASETPQHDRLSGAGNDFVDVPDDAVDDEELPFV